MTLEEIDAENQRLREYVRSLQQAVNGREKELAELKATVVRQDVIIKSLVESLRR